MVRPAQAVRQAQPVHDGQPVCGRVLLRVAAFRAAPARSGTLHRPGHRPLRTVSAHRGRHLWRVGRRRGGRVPRRDLRQQRGGRRCAGAQAGRDLLPPPEGLQGQGNRAYPGGRGGAAGERHGQVGQEDQDPDQGRGRRGQGAAGRVRGLWPDGRAGDVRGGGDEGGEGRGHSRRGGCLYLRGQRHRLLRGGHDQCVGSSGQEGVPVR